jgi:hypothetical protein
MKLRPVQRMAAWIGRMAAGRRKSEAMPAEESDLPPLPVPEGSVSISPPPGYEWGREYMWIGPDELLAAFHHQTTAYTSFPPVSCWRYCVARYHTKTGGVSLLTQNNEATPLAAQFRFSPDGAWYLALAEHQPMTGRQQYAYYLCATDDSRREIVYYEGSWGTTWWLDDHRWQNKTAIWLGDSQHWLLLPWTPENRAVRRLFDRQGMPMEFPAALTSCDLILSTGPSPTILNEAWQRKEDAPVEIGFWDPVASSHHRLQAFLPASGWVHEVAISPSGKRFAWLLGVEFEAERFSPPQRGGPDTRIGVHYQLWTTDLDGSSPRLIAEEVGEMWHQQGSYTGEWRGSGWIHTLRWTSDSSALSFFSDRKLFLLPVA